ncbi:DUF2147 domain-containing protein [Flavipsychrobacter stenotrophus]|uniref:DUF2147 domain-containing protein n=1 Tax=Flavipsychrobacter stenotrophus TaxID=2077091 RepID=A0A2S7SQ98_9BACT|nr:DUF2147 domain-containing protein [Flavipsychrobacter stenotrophus]PQJ08811.1 DUF2147 domain-containing protein [Flavipsychrobacter stenotrophus]
MRLGILFGIGLLLNMGCFAQCPFREGEGDGILGRWENVDHTLGIEVYKSGEDFKAKIIWFRDHDNLANPADKRKDAHNPYPLLRDRKIVGMDVLRGLIYNKKEKRWENGFIYDATSGREWSSSATLSTNGRLRVRGYWKFEWIGRTMTFIRL